MLVFICLFMYLICLLVFSLFSYSVRFVFLYYLCISSVISFVLYLFRLVFAGV